jgi:hypothetical protein
MALHSIDVRAVRKTLEEQSAKAEQLRRLL